MNWRETNRQAWNKIAGGDNQFARVATDEECSHPLKVLDGRGWLPADMTGKKVLCLASGGGWQSILYAMTGADVTVVDISDTMLELDRREAERRGLKVRTVRASMDDMPELVDGFFDIIHQPVSTCYVPELLPVYREIARVTKDGGLYISQHKQHLHRWEQLVGDLCVSGFLIEDLREPLRADRTAPVSSYKYRGRFLPPYLRMKARRRPRAEITSSESESKPSLWTP